MLIKYFSAVVFFFFTILFFAVEPIKACQCGGNMPTVMRSFNQAENVFIGEIIKFGTEEPVNKFNSRLGATFLVKKVYKGSLKEGDTKFFVQGSGDDCQIGFGENMIGTKLLIYDSDVWRKSSIYQREGITFCGRSQNANRPSSDLLYLDNLDKVQGKTRIYGNVWFSDNNEKKEGRKIKIIGKDQTYEVTTDKNGIYEIYDLPVGEYFLEPEIPQNWKVSREFFTWENRYLDYGDLENQYNSNRFSIKLSEKSDASIDFFFVPNNFIQGKATDSSGKPLKGVCVYALRSSEPKFTYSKGACTNENGQFVITELNKDSYVLVISGDVIRPSHPFATAYFPGVKNREEATTLKVSEGDSIVLPDFKVPEILETLTLQGNATYSDESPVTWGGYVEFTPDIKDENIKGNFVGEFNSFTKEDGSFSLKIFKGQTGKLRLEKLFNNEDIEKCPELKKAVIEERTEQTIKVSTNWIEIKADQDLKDIKLIFPFPKCSNPN